jgi:hypothetical protein
MKSDLSRNTDKSCHFNLGLLVIFLLEDIKCTHPIHLSLLSFFLNKHSNIVKVVTDT